MYGVVVMDNYDSILRIVVGFEDEEQAQAYIQQEINNIHEPYNVEYDGYTWTVRGADSLTYHIGPVGTYSQPLTLSDTFTEIPLKIQNTPMEEPAQSNDESEEGPSSDATLEQRVTSVENQLRNVWEELSHINRTMLNTFERARKAF